MGQLGGMGRLLVGAVLMAAWGGVARGEPRCVQVLGWRSGDCPAEVERGPDRAESAFWRQRNTGSRPSSSRLTGPIVPGIGPANLMGVPAPGGPTNEGALSLDDLMLRLDSRGGYQGRRPGYQFTIERDGTIHFENPPPIQGFALAGLGFAAVFDLTDLVMRAHHMDPYGYDKGRVVELTRTMRDKMSAAERPRRLAAALARLPGELDALWRRSDLSPAERRETLFGLWDDLLEDDQTGAGAPELQAAAQARVEILRFVRQRLPANSADAFTDGELGRLNVRRLSRVPFAPYRD
jgi:hypothetical protein